MSKVLYLSVLIITFCSVQAKAQRDTIFVYMRNPYFDAEPVTGVPVSTKDSAQFVRTVMSPDSSVDKTLFPVADFYLDGRKKMVATSNLGSAFVNLQGSAIEFYPNGKKKIICNYKHGKLDGDMIEMYPNGKIYLSGTYEQGKLKLITCNDSTGKALADNGSGTWIKYSSDFKSIAEQGDVDGGYEKGEWKGILSDSVYYVRNYNRGVITTAACYDNKGHQYPFTYADNIPEFKGGTNGFMQFLIRTVRYPTDARQDGEQGRVILTFCVENDGSLTDIEVLKSAGKSLDKEAIRVMKLSPIWTPAHKGGIPVGCQYSVPLSFTLAGR